MNQADIQSLLDPLPVQAELLRDRRVAFVGKLGGMNRKQAAQLVSDCGGILIESRVDQFELADLIVIGADELPVDGNSQTLDDRIVELAEKGSLEIIGETEFWQRLGLVDDSTDVRRLYTPAMLAQLADVPLSTIRRWQRRKLIVPAHQVYQLPYYDYQEVVTARRLANLIAKGASPKSIEDKLSRLNEFCQEIGRPLSQLSVLVEGRHVLLRQDGGLVEPGGQKRIDFEALEADSSSSEDASATIVPLDSSQQVVDQLTSPDQFLALAMELEDSGETQQAIEVYRAMLLALGPTAEICFQIAELLYFDHQYGAARERYYSAIELDETFVEARANLGCVLLEMGEVEMAINAFQGALKHHPDYPDVHFHLARTLDQAGQMEEAENHWKTFLDLSPHSPWAAEARDRLGVT